METEVPSRGKADSVEEGLRAAGQATELPVVVDYFATEDVITCTLPDGVQWVQHKLLTEGDRRKYRNKTSRNLRIKRATDEASMDMASGDDLHVLLEIAIVNWNLKRGGKEVPFSKGTPGATLSQFLDAAPPSIIDHIHKDITKHNPWLLGDISLEDMIKEKESLEEMIEVKRREEEGKVS
jgi:hypothetical protein